MKEKLTALGSVLAAVLASSCCWGPLLLAGLGAGGAGFASGLAPYRPYFMGATFIFLAGAWYFTLRRPRALIGAPGAKTTPPGEACCVQETCCTPNGARRRNILLLSGITAFALVMLAFPKLTTVLAGSQTPSPAIEGATGPVASTALGIKGMTCEACEGHLQKALLKVPGVVSAKVSSQTASAQVTFQRGKVSTEELKQAVAKAGYSVSSVRPLTEPSPSS